MEGIAAEIDRIGGRIIGVSPDSPAESKALAERLSLNHIRILSDPDLAVTDIYGLRHRAGRASTGEDKPYPTTFIIDKNGIVRARFENETYRERPVAENVLEAITRAAG